MKVLFFNTFFYPNVVGGAENSVRLLAGALKKQSIEPVIVSTSNKDYIDSVDGIKVYYVKVPNLYWGFYGKQQPFYLKPFWHLIDSFNPFASNKIRKILKIEEPNVVHSNNLCGFSVNVWRVVKSMNIPIVHTMRDYYLLCPKSTMFYNGKNADPLPLTAKIYSIPKKILSKKVDAVVGVSDFILQRHLKDEYFKNAKVKTHIYNPSPQLSENHENKVNNNKLVFGYVGLISPTKGVEKLIQEFNLAKSNGSKLLIFGKGETEKYYNYMVDTYSSDTVKFMGYEKVDNIYRQINILIICSLWHEPFPRTLIEAYTYGIPVVASNTGGTQAMVKEGVTGFIYDPFIGGNLAKSIYKISNVNLSSLSSNARDISKSFLEETIISEYISVYRNVISNS
ncbi:MAG: glycosyltransferase family 4 protein [Fibrobacterales bacterium]